MDVPTWRNTEMLDDFFVKGRNMWPDLDELRNLGLDRSRVPDDVVRFIRSTSLNEYGIVHYTKGYYRAYGDDYKMAVWSTIWGGEEYLHSLVLRQILKGLGEDITQKQFDGLESGAYERNYDGYLAATRVEPISTRMQQMVYGVVQEFSAVIAYGAVADACNEPTIERLLRRMAKDEMRHCRFNQLCLEQLALNSREEERAAIWPQFSTVFKDFRMPTEHIDMFNEFEMGTDLYTSFWTPKHRSKMVLFLTHYFGQYRQPPYLPGSVTKGKARQTAPESVAV